MIYCWKFIKEEGFLENEELDIQVSMDNKDLLQLKNNLTSNLEEFQIDLNRTPDYCPYDIDTGGSVFPGEKKHFSSLCFVINKSDDTIRIYEENAKIKIELNRSGFSKLIENVHFVNNVSGLIYDTCLDGVLMNCDKQVEIVFWGIIKGEPAYMG